MKTLEFIFYITFIPKYWKIYLKALGFTNAKYNDMIVWVENTHNLNVGDVVKLSGKRQTKSLPRIILGIFPLERVGFWGTQLYPLVLRKY